MLKTIFVGEETSFFQKDPRLRLLAMRKWRRKNNWKQLVESSTVNFSFPSPAQLFFVSGPVWTYDHIFVLSRLRRVLKWGLLFHESRYLTTTGHSPFTWEWLCWLSPLLSQTHSSLAHRFSVRVTLRKAVYPQSVRLGDKPLETHDQYSFFNWTLDAIVQHTLSREHGPAVCNCC
jgi:hypothetical protein